MGYIWRVWKDNRFAGYVVEPSEASAYLRARDMYGSNIRVERMGK
jgi:hypothetical protein